MTYLALCFTLAVLFLNLWGAALWVGTFLRNRWLALAAAPWLFTTAMFCIESFVGLGALRGLGLATTLISLLAIAASAGLLPQSWFKPVWNSTLDEWRQEFAPARMAAPLLVLAAIYGYALTWRIAFPNIDGSAEKIPDLAYICAYLPGEGVPPKDPWLHPFTSAHYYSFQYYAAALMGRMFGLSPGLTYNLGFCAMVGLAGLAFAGAVTMMAQRLSTRIAVVVAFVLGGTGASGWIHLFYKDPALWSGMRFIGSLPYDKAPWGTKLQEYAAQYKRVELPGEPFSYSIFLGDYHPPFSGFYLLGLGVLAAALWQNTRRPIFGALVGATFTWSILANTWTLPLQGLAACVWCLWNFKAWRQLVPTLAAGAAVVWLACWGYLAPFAAASAEYKTAFRLVQPGDHTPLLLFLLYLAPTIGLAIVSIYTQRKEGVWVGLCGTVAIIVSEFVYLDDVYVAEFERFNTTLKWWPWIASLMLLLAAPIIIERANRPIVRRLGWLFCLYPTIFAYDLAAHWVRAPKADFGKLDGDNYLRRDEPARYILDRLKAEPKGVVVERPNKDSFTNSAVLPLFAGHRLWLGWTGHEQLWRGYAGYIGQRLDRLLRFYSGDLADGTEWFQAEGIDYILWYQEADTNELWERVAPALREHYVWCEVYIVHGGKKVGFWRRKANLAP
jgi:hypothetical protein